MHHDYGAICLIIKELKSEIQEIKILWDSIRTQNPTFEQVSEEHWHIREAQIWLHGATEVAEANELERWLYHSPSHRPAERSPADDHYKGWAEHILENGVYADFTEEHLETPRKREQLGEFIKRLAIKVETNGKGTKKQFLALKSFLEYVRSNHLAFIEDIFPKKMDLSAGRIIRRIPPQVYPLSIEVAGEVVKALADEITDGRTNARHHAIEALALVWMCLTASRIRLPRTLASMHEIPSSALIRSDIVPQLLVPSLFGEQPIRISKMVKLFLSAVANLPSSPSRQTILQTTIEDLRKPFRRVISKVNRDVSMGEITFATFLSPPHYAGRHSR